MKATTCPKSGGIDIKRIALTAVLLSTAHCSGGAEAPVPTISEAPVKHAQSDCTCSVSCGIDVFECDVHCVLEPWESEPPQSEIDACCDRAIEGCDDGRQCSATQDCMWGYCNDGRCEY